MRRFIPTKIQCSKFIAQNAKFKFIYIFTFVYVFDFESQNKYRLAFQNFKFHWFLQNHQL